MVADDVANGHFGRPPATRFPPEPNGFLHMGHAKSICLNFGIAKEFGGTCNLRFDDTNPATEDVKYVEAIQRDVQWLGFQWDNLFYASDYFEKLYDIAESLVLKGKAYVDSQNEEQIRAGRGTVTSAGTPGPYRDRSVEENLDLLRRMRAEGITTPVLFLTAKDAVEDRIAGLTMGGDDYITKPFSLGEVLARIRVVLRRRGHEIEVAPANIRTFADIEMDEDAHEVVKAGEPVELSPTEFKLLRYLMENAGRVLSKAQILDNVWHYDFGGEATVVESYISYLRRKIDTTEPRLLHTVRGVGYVLRQPKV